LNQRFANKRPEKTCRLTFGQANRLLNKSNADTLLTDFPETGVSPNPALLAIVILVNFRGFRGLLFVQAPFQAVFEKKSMIQRVFLKNGPVLYGFRVLNW
jgi:hypothetical protein